MMDEDVSEESDRRISVVGSLQASRACRTLPAAENHTMLKSTVTLFSALFLHLTAVLSLFPSSSERNLSNPATSWSNVSPTSTTFQIPLKLSFPFPSRTSPKTSTLVGSAPTTKWGSPRKSRRSHSRYPSGSLSAELHPSVSLYILGFPPDPNKHRCSLAHPA